MRSGRALILSVQAGPSGDSPRGCDARPQPIPRRATSWSSVVIGVVAQRPSGQIGPGRTSRLGSAHHRRSQARNAFVPSVLLTLPVGTVKSGADQAGAMYESLIQIGTNATRVLPTQGNRSPAPARKIAQGLHDGSDRLKRQKTASLQNLGAGIASRPALRDQARSAG